MSPKLSTPPSGTYSSGAGGAARQRPGVADDGDASARRGRRGWCRSSSWPREDFGKLPDDRYVIRTASNSGTWRKTATEARRRIAECRSVAVILNTVRDACEVYRALAGDKGHPASASAGPAAVLPGSRRPSRRSAGLEAGRPFGVVCTQVLEAGVDLSFRSLLRALPIFPSVVQAAGRANRHATAGGPARSSFSITVAGGAQSRQYIYDSEPARRITDEVLAADPIGRARCPCGPG